MKKEIIISLCALFISTTASAQSPDFFDVDAAQGGKMKKCGKQAWNSTSPSDVQKTQATVFFGEAKAVYEMHKPDMKAAKADMKAAWMKHPVVRDEVVTAETRLLSHFMPVKDAFRDAGISTINLLDATQRAVFNNSFAACLKEK